MRITTGCDVSLSYRLFDAQGELADETDEPVRYRHGEGDILPGLEEALGDAEEGARLEVELEDAYGPYDPEGLFTVPRAELPGDVELSPGDWISVELEAEPGEELDPEAAEGLEARVVEVHADEVVLDANHPLAGQRVRFEVEVLSVERR